MIYNFILIFSSLPTTKCKNLLAIQKFCGNILKSHICKTFYLKNITNVTIKFVTEKKCYQDTSTKTSSNHSKFFNVGNDCIEIVINIMGTGHLGNRISW
jgi:hypothetical protein